MKRILLLIMIFSTALEGKADIERIEFYNQTITIDVHHSVLSIKGKGVSEVGLKNFYMRAKRSNYIGLLNSLLLVKTTYNFSDFFFYRFVERVAFTLYKRKIDRTYWQWFLLGELGFKVTVGFGQGGAHFFIESKDRLYGIVKAKEFYCFTCTSPLKYEFPNFYPYRGGNSLSVMIFTPPTLLNKDTVMRTFIMPGCDNFEQSKVAIKIDRNLVKMYDEVPNAKLGYKFNVDFTRESQSLVDSLRHRIKNLNDSMKVNYLMEFLSLNVAYQADGFTFDTKGKWLFPEQVLFLKNGDCEDKSALLFSLFRLLLGRPMLILHYPNEEHLNIAISLNLSCPPNVIHGGRPYYTCETSVEGGFIPIGLDRIAHETEYVIEEIF